MSCAPWLSCSAWCVYCQKILLRFVHVLTRLTLLSTLVNIAINIFILSVLSLLLLSD